jgi:hypothetical protein
MSVYLAPLESWQWFSRMRAFMLLVYVGEAGVLEIPLAVTASERRGSAPLSSPIPNRDSHLQRDEGEGLAAPLTRAFSGRISEPGQPFNYATPELSLIRVNFTHVQTWQSLNNMTFSSAQNASAIIKVAIQ